MSHADDTAGSRRDFLYYATAGAGVFLVLAHAAEPIDAPAPTLAIPARMRAHVSVRMLR